MSGKPLEAFLTLVLFIVLVVLASACRNEPQVPVTPPKPPAVREEFRLPASCAGATPVRFGGKGVIHPKLVRTGRFGLPRGTNGNEMVIVEAILRRDGTVCAAAHFRGGTREVQEYIEDFKTWQFQPATRNGSAIDYLGLFTMSAEPGGAPAPN